MSVKVFSHHQARVEVTSEDGLCHNVKSQASLKTQTVITDYFH